MKLTDIIVAMETIGNVYMLVDIKTVYKYENGKRTEEVEGYTYIIALPQKAYERIEVKILGKKMIELVDNEYPEVEFAGLELYIVWQGDYKLAARAKGIRRKQIQKNL